MRQILTRRWVEALRGLAYVMRVNSSNLVTWWHNDVIYESTARKNTVDLLGPTSWVTGFADPVRGWRGLSREEAWEQYIHYLIQTLRSGALPEAKR